MIELSGYTTIPEASKRLGLTPDAMYKRVYRRQIKSVKLGHVTLVPVDQKPARPKRV